MMTMMAPTCTVVAPSNAMNTWLVMMRSPDVISFDAMLFWSIYAR